MALTRRMDRMLWRLVVASALILVLIQAALRSSLFLAIFSRVDRLEGAGQSHITQIAAWERIFAAKALSNQTATMSVSLELLQPSASAKVKLLINGEIKGNFAQSLLTVGVNHGDLLEIDASEENGVVTVRVIEVSAELQHPMVDQYFQVSQAIRPLGRVVSKSIR